MSDKFDVSLEKPTKWMFVWFAAFIFGISAVSWFAVRAGLFGSHVIDNALPNYEEFQSIYNTCQKLNADLETVRAIPEDDKSFSMISKAQTIAAKRQQMTRWIEEYNAKSKMWNRSMWKSSSLPHQLSTSDFNHYDN